MNCAKAEGSDAVLGNDDDDAIENEAMTFEPTWASTIFVTQTNKQTNKIESNRSNQTELNQIKSSPNLMLLMNVPFSGISSVCCQFQGLYGALHKGLFPRVQ